MDKNLHIICLNVPYPPDYGGVYDLFYKLPALQSQGVKIHLHCFDSGRGDQPELNKYCERVFYHRRNTGHKGISNKLPYIVASRKNDELLENLLHDDYPILMEGVHCSYLVLDKRFDKRKKFLRLHNVEHLYYAHLFSCTNNLIKKIYFLRESKLLKGYEGELVKNVTACWGVAKKDVMYYRDKLHCKRTDYLPLFLPAWQMRFRESMGTYCLYHGDLSVPANERIAMWLLYHVFDKIEIPFVIAGKNPSEKLEKKVRRRANVCLIINPSENEMQDMIAKAHIHVLPSFNSTGIKLKLLNALYNGKHCVVNHCMIEGTGLNDLCHIADSPKAFIEIIDQLYHQPFCEDEIEARRKLLYNEYNNEANARQMVKWIWEMYV